MGEAEHLGHGPVLGDEASGLPPLAGGVLLGRVEGPQGHPQGLGRDFHAGLGEKAVQGLDTPVQFADQVFPGHPDPAEDHLGAGGHLDPQLVPQAGHADPGAVPLDQDGREARIIRGLRVGLGGDDEVGGLEAVGGEDLGAVDDESVAVPFGPGVEPGQVAAVIGFGQADGRETAALGQPGQPASFLFFIAGDGQHVRDDAHQGEGHADGRVGPAVLDDAEHFFGQTIAGPAVLLGRVHGGQAQLGVSGEQVRGKGLFSGRVRGDDPRELGLGELPGGPLQIPLFGGQRRPGVRPGREALVKKAVEVVHDPLSSCP